MISSNNHFLICLENDAFILFHHGLPNAECLVFCFSVLINYVLVASLVFNFMLNCPIFVKILEIEFLSKKRY